MEDEELSSFYTQRVKSFSYLPLVDFDEKSIEKLFESLNIPCKYCVNLKHEELGILLPPLYESVVDINKELVVFKRFGANNFDLYSRTGLFLETVNQRLFIYESGLYVIEGETQGVLKHFDTEEGSNRTVFKDLEIKTYDIREYDCQFLADKFNFLGGQIDNVIWKSEINEIIHGEQFTLENMLVFCSEDSLLKAKSKIGFSNA